MSRPACSAGTITFWLSSIPGFCKGIRLASTLIYIITSCTHSLTFQPSPSFISRAFNTITSIGTRKDIKCRKYITSIIRCRLLLFCSFNTNTICIDSRRGYSPAAGTSTLMMNSVDDWSTTGPLFTTTKDIFLNTICSFISWMFILFIVFYRIWRRLSIKNPSSIDVNIRNINI
uniref:Uncharacterized protein n=1 Tax=Meloidogyne incognita TaxID=6306 RepID=A0A914MMK0_MELIC